MKKIIGMFLVLTSLATAQASIDQNIKYSQKNDEVIELQEFLVDKGFLTVSPTGFFGLLTLKAVKLYQTTVGIPSTGYVGILTRKAINLDLEVEIVSSLQAEKEEISTSVQPAAGSTEVVIPQQEPKMVSPPPPPQPSVVNVVPETHSDKPTCTLTAEKSLNNAGEEVGKVSWISTNTESGFMRGYNLTEDVYVNGQLQGNTIASGTISGLTLDSPNFRAVFTGRGGEVICEASISR